MKSEGVKDCVKWIEKRIKSHKVNMANSDYYYIEQSKIRDEAILTELTSVKISLEKYYKKLKHEEEK